MRRRQLPDPLAEARCTIGTLQAALTRAHERIRELEHVAASANERASQAIELADRVQMDAFAREHQARTAQEGAGAPLWRRDASP